MPLTGINNVPLEDTRAAIEESEICFGVQHYFHELDQDMSGDIDIDEYKQVLDYLELDDVPPENVQRIFEDIKSENKQMSVFNLSKPVANDMSLEQFQLALIAQFMDVTYISRHKNVQKPE